MILNEIFLSFGTNAKNQSFDITLGGITVILPQFTMRLKRSGFSLVLSLTIMASMVLMVIVLASFLQVESRLAQSHAGYLRARFNALSAAKVAIGQIQQLAGPDQRVTMRADMFSPEITPPGPITTPALPRTGAYPALYNPNSPGGAVVAHQKRFLTGVWATGGVQSKKVRDWDVSDPHNTRLFLGWLCSPMYKSTGGDPEAPDTSAGKLPNFLPNSSYYNAATGQAIMTESQVLIDDLGTTMEAAPNGILVPLVSSGTVSWPTTAVSRLQQEYYGAVDMRPVPLPGPINAGGKLLGANGRYAFWVGDEGIKAKMNLPDTYPKSTTGASLTLANAYNWEKEMGGSAAQRNGIEAIRQADRPTLPATFQADFQTWRNADITTANGRTGKPESLQLPKTLSTASLANWAAQMVGGTGTPAGQTAGQTMADGMRALWHDVTSWSYSTLTDTYNGGLKYDLSTAFELPYVTYRGLEIYPDQKNPVATSNDNRRQSLFHNAPGFADLDFNRPNLVDKIASPQDLLAAYPRASEWAPRYTAGLLGSGYNLLKTQNGGETPERMGFVYEVPVGSRFFNTTTSMVNGASFTRLDTTTTQPLGTSPITPVRIHSLPWSELNPDDPENIKGRVVRGPTWDLYRNYYRMYKREVEAAGIANPAGGLMGQAPVSDGNTLVARGLEPLTFASGNRVTPLSKSTDVNGKLRKYTTWPLKGDNDQAFDSHETFYDSNLTSATYTDFYYRNNLSDTTFGPDFQADKRLFQPFNIYTPGTPTSPGTTGLLNIQWSYGNVNNITPGVFGTYEHSGMAIPSATASTGPRPDSFYDLPTGSPGFQGAPSSATVTTNTTTRTWPTSMNIAPSVIRFAMVYSTVWNQDMLGIVVDPYITIHNPYDCAIEFEGIGMVSNDQSMTYYFEFECGGNAANDFSSNRYVIGDICLSQSTTDGRELSFRAVAGQRGTTRNRPAVLRLEPGEVRIVSPSQALRRTDLYGTSPVAIPGDIVFEQQSRMFFPMNTYVGMARVLQYTANKPTVLCEDFTDQQINDESPGWNNNPPVLSALMNKWWMENARSTARAVKINLPGWTGTVPSLNAELNRVGKKPFVKFRNFGWTNWSGYIVNNTSRATNATAGMGGNLHYNFYLLNQKSAKQLLPLNWERRWSGGRDTGFTPGAANPKVSGSFKIGEDTPHGWWTVDQPLLLNLQTLSAGWPNFGNSNRGYELDPDDRWANPADTWDFHVKAYGNWGPRNDPEFAKPLTFYDDLANTVREDQFGKLPVQGPSGENLATWSTPGSNVAKQPVLLFDMLVRGAKESSASLDKWYPSNYNAWPNHQSGATDRIQTPSELRAAPMNPYFTSTRAQQAYLLGYDGKAHGPVGWITRQIPLTSSVLPIDLNGDNAFWGASVEVGSGGQNNVVLYPIPRRPMLSLSQLGSVAFAQSNTDPDLTVGSSFAHPGIIDLTKIVDWPGPKVLSAGEISQLAATGQSKYWVPEHGYVAKSMGEGTIRNRSNVRTDHAFAANITLWDSFFFSGLNLNAASYHSTSGNWPSGANLPVDATVKQYQEEYLKSQGVADPSSFASLKTALDAGFLPLANKRVAYTPDYKPASATFPKVDEFPHPAFLASKSLYNGGFNVNSTSKAAWKAVLSAMKGQLLPNAAGGSTSTALTKFARAIDPNSANGSSKPWTSYRELNDNEIDALAQAVVNEVRRRGPFMSLADFVNRRLINDDAFGLKGALQAAIDFTDAGSFPVNKNAITNGGGTFGAPVAANLMNFNALTTRRIQNYPSANPWLDVPNVDRFPSLRAMSTTNDKTKVTAALGAPGIVTQLDVLNSIGPNLTARSDTFVVRAYGEALDNSGNTIGKAWIEVIVQRTADYIGPAGVDPNRRKLAYRGVDANQGDNSEKDPKVINDAKTILEKFERRTLTPTTDDANLNRVFGRRFKAVNLRWLSATEI
jgi:hypothetical protein